MRSSWAASPGLASPSGYQSPVGLLLLLLYIVVLLVAHGQLFERLNQRKSTPPLCQEFIRPRLVVLSKNVVIVVLAIIAVGVMVSLSLSSFTVVVVVVFVVAVAIVVVVKILPSP